MNIELIVQFTECKKAHHMICLTGYEEIIKQDYNLLVDICVEPEEVQKKTMKLNTKIKNIVAKKHVLRDEINQIIEEK